MCCAVLLMLLCRCRFARPRPSPLPKEFAKIYELCEFILDRSQKPALLNGTLQTLQRFLTWIPLGYIFERQLIE